MVKVRTVKCFNGIEIPIIGLGTGNSKPGEVTQAVKDAIKIGYRLIDCAYVYGNEKEVGEALSAVFAEGIVKREDVFITSKLWNTFHRPDLVEKALKETLTNLKLDYLDLYLIHWPMAYKEEAELFPRREDGTIIFSDVDYVDTWKELEKLQEKGLVKSIGLSNFNEKQIERVLSIAKIKPVNLQVECHPYLNQKKLIDFCKSKGITVTAYSPLGSPDRPFAKPGDVELLKDPKLTGIAAKYNKSPAQILLRFQVDRGIIVIPKSVNKNRLQQNFDIFDFTLSSEDLAVLDSFNCNGRILKLEAAIGHPHHPFETQ
ncbi:aldo-keto reductase family 1 member B1-like isoform X2 [Diorhabda sublineata]|uniref:aldo-keto reductase family 1 member B1-like isoform X2 n=1 Tax=Diorhabda sublineata TaxID=1163346 RepID=UPI0024E0C4F9|nr:aldo-keto reductase family 1 member B1-like isoform X2 [Diorhabda sublineata]